jgi:hypothetical protein
MKKAKNPNKLLCSYDIPKTKNEHYIWIKRTLNNGHVFYAKFPCFNPDFYSNMMKEEFKIQI